VVKTPICIGVTGAHSTGNTVLLRRIEMELRAQGVTVGSPGEVRLYKPLFRVSPVGRPCRGTRTETPGCASG
jgi:molybdopterin-guanine dinucleotide biosynthesis protein